MEIKPIRQKWKSTMTDRERFNRQMHRQSVDRCFNWEIEPWQECYTQWDIFRDNGVTNPGEVKKFLSFDVRKNISEYVGIFDPSESWQMKTFTWPEIPSRVIEVREGKKLISNECGVIAEVPSGGSGSSIPHFIKSSINTPDDWKRIKEQHFDLKHPTRPFNIEALKKVIPPDDERDFPLSIFIGSMIGRIRDMLTVIGLGYAIYDYPEMVEDMVETMCQVVEFALDQLLPHFKFDLAESWEDICFNHGPLVSVDFFKNVIVPRYKRIHKKLMAYGIDIWRMDCDGNIWPLIPCFIEGGANCMFPLEVNGSGHPREIIEKYEGQLVFMGGIDKIQLIAGPEAIKEYLKSIEKYVVRGGFIPFVDHNVPPDVKPENYLYYLDLKEKMFGMG